jgi:pilus assembly protein CpaC
MTMTRKAPGPVLAMLGLLIGASGGASAADRSELVAGGRAVSAPMLNVSADEQGVARRLDLSIGRSVIVELPRDAKEVFVANPKVANAVVRSTRKLFIIGMENGSTTIFVMDNDGRQIAAIEATVGRDLTVLRQTLRTALPTARVEVRPAGDSVLLTGLVGSASEAQQAVDIANAFVGVSGGLLSSTKGAVINSLTIKGKDQVMLRVSVVEVARSVVKQLGVNLDGNWSAFNFHTEAVFPIASQVLAGTNQLGASGRSGNSRVNGVLQAFERAGVSRVLAEPTIVAVSGEAATFTAGGEIPLPSAPDCTSTSPTGAVICRPGGASFKPYGVSLNFTPVVLSENRISMRVSTEVTEPDYETQVTLQGVGVPGLRVRKSATTIELASGATMMTAGLLSQSNAQAVAGLPGAMNLPILGALFRSRDYQRKETELVILVTPYIAKPMEAKEAARPDDGFVEAHDGQAVLLGRLNRLYGVAGAAPAGAGLKGSFGFITD